MLYSCELRFLAISCQRIPIQSNPRHQETKTIWKIQKLNKIYLHLAITIILQHNWNISFDEITLLITDHSLMSSSFKFSYSRATVSFRSIRHPTRYKWPIITTWGGGVTPFTFNGPSATATGAFKTYRIPNWSKQKAWRPSIYLLFQMYHFLIVVTEWKMPIILHIIGDLIFALKVGRCRITFSMVLFYRNFYGKLLHCIYFI